MADTAKVPNSSRWSQLDIDSRRRWDGAGISLRSDDQTAVLLSVFPLLLRDPADASSAWSDAAAQSDLPSRVVVPVGLFGSLVRLSCGACSRLLKRDGLKVEDLGPIFPIKAVDALLGLAGGCGIYLFKEAYHRAIGGLVSGSIVNVALTQNFSLLERTLLDRLGFLGAIVIVGPLVEEIVFSAYAMTSLERVWGRRFLASWSGYLMGGDYSQRPDARTSAGPRLIQPGPCLRGRILL